jgi:hypothetical protein
MKSSDIATVYDQLPLGSIVQIIQDGLPKVPKARPMPSSDTLKAELEKTKGQDQLGSKSASTSLTVEQMRAAGALAAERQKQTSTTRGSSARPKDKATPVLNNGEIIAQNKNPRA